jgi:hypothetical protein
VAELLAPSYFSQHSRLFLICVSVMECRRPDADSPHTHTHSPHEFFRVVCVCEEVLAVLHTADAIEVQMGRRVLHTHNTSCLND